MSWVIRASDLEDDTDAIKFPWQGDGEEDKTETPEHEKSETPEVENKEEAGKGDVDWKEDEKSEPTEDETTETPADEKTEKESEWTSINDLSDSELEAMSDEELDALLEKMEETQEDKTEDITGESSDKDVQFALQEKDALLKSVSDRLESVIKENADMKVQLAENKIYWWDGKEEMMVFHKNMTGAKDGDEWMKSKALGFLDKMRAELTGKTFGESEIDSDTDKISESNSIKSKTDLNKPSNEWLDDAIKVL